MKYLKLIINSSYSFDEEFNTYIRGEFHYIDETEIKLFDENGNFYMNHIIENRSVEHNKKCLINELEFHIYNKVFQIGFDFKVIKTGYISTIDDLQKYPWEFFGCEIEYSPDLFSSYHKPEREKKSKPKIMSCSGSAKYSVFQNIGKQILEFNYKQYKKNFDKFIKENELDEALVRQANWIFDCNLILISDFFMCEVEQLKSPNFSVKTQMIKKFMKKIAIKAKQA
tara:strand:+ start:43 stop:720 length:678 start_codon:yes stop_codon:yes gene_type:complete